MSKQLGGAAGALDGGGRHTTFKFLLTLVIVESVSSFEGTMIFAAMKVLYEDFNDPIMVGWIVTAFVLVNAVTSTIGARLGDIYGRRKVLAIVVAISGLGSLMSAMSTEVYGVIAGRAVQGLAGPILALTVGIIRENLPAHRIPFGIGLMGATAMVSSAVAFQVSGIIIDHLPWRVIFIFSTAYAFFALIPLMAWVPKSKPVPSKDKLDFIGAALFVPAVAGLLFAIGKVRDWGLFDERTLWLAGLSLMLLAVFAVYEWRHKHPFIDVRLLTNRQIALANLILMMSGMGAMQSGMIISLLFQQPTATGIGLGLSGTMTGTIMFLSLMMGVVGGPWAGAVAGRVGGRMPMIMGTSMMLVAWIAILARHDSFWWIGVMLLIHGLGQTIVFAGAPMLVTESVPPGRTSEANGLSNVLRQTAMAVGVQGLSFIIGINSVQTPGVQGEFPTAMGYTILLTLIVATCVIAVIAAIALPKRKGYMQDGQLMPH